MTSQPRSPSWLRRCAGTKVVTDDASTPSGRSRFRTGGRKNNADECGFGYRMQTDITIGNVRMMRINENIPATPPPNGAFAPILHVKMRADASKRSINPNHGAADEYGR